MGIGNLGNNFGKLTAQQHAKAQVKQAAEENKPQVQDGSKVDIQKAGAKINEATLKAGQVDLSANLFASISNDIDDIGGGNKSNEPMLYADKPKSNSGGSTSGGSSGHQHTELEEAMIREMQENAVKDPGWSAGAALVYLGSRLYHWIKGD